MSSSPVVNNWQAGVVATDFGDVVSYPEMALDQFLTSKFGQSASDRTIGSGRPIYGAMHVPVAGKDCGIQVKFNTDRTVRNVTIAIHGSPILYDYEELAKQQTGYCFSEIHPVYFDAWGRVVLSHDPHFNCPYLVVEYGAVRRT
ncbi:MAG: hypothetical protein U0929_08845 [Planctomycetaceae bacterium]